MIHDDDESPPLTFEAMEAETYAGFAIWRAQLHAMIPSVRDAAHLHAKLDRIIDGLIERQREEFARMRARLEREGFFDD